MSCCRRRSARREIIGGRSGKRGLRREGNTLARLPSRLRYGFWRETCRAHASLPGRATEPFQEWQLCKDEPRAMEPTAPGAPHKCRCVNISTVLAPPLLSSTHHNPAAFLPTQPNPLTLASLRCPHAVCLHHHGGEHTSTSHLRHAAVLLRTLRTFGGRLEIGAASSLPSKGQCRRLPNRSRRDGLVAWPCFLCLE